MSKPHYHSVIISDVHLGTKDSKAKEAVEFLKSITCDKLFLNGDIVDGWAMKSGGSWKDSHTKFIRTVLKKMEKEDTEVIYIRGNHDEFLEKFLPVAFGGLKIEQEFLYETEKGNYLIVHGDGFDSVTTNYKFMAKLGSIGYDFLLRVNRLYNHWRVWRGKPYFSLSKKVKASIKSAVTFVDRYEDQLQQFAQVRDCKGIICGHIHTAADKMVGDVHYLNSGDWVESLTAIVEPQSGRFELIEFESFTTKSSPVIEEEEENVVEFAAA